MKRNKLEYIVEDEKAHEIMVRGEKAFAFDLASGWHVERVLVDAFRIGDEINEIQITIKRNCGAKMECD